MKKKSLIFVLGLVPLLPCSSRFAYGLLIAAELWILFCAYLLAQKIIELLEIKNENGKRLCSVLFAVIVATLFSQVTAILFPLAELCLRFYIYALPFLYILYFCLADYTEEYQSFEIIGFYSLCLLALSLLRELCFFGSISFLIPSGLFSLQIIPNDFLLFKFFGTNAGALILAAIAVWIYFSIRKARFIPFEEQER